MDSRHDNGQARLSSVSRRTRSNWDAFYRGRHNEIKKKPGNNQDCTIISTKNESFVQKVEIGKNDDSTTSTEDDDSEEIIIEDDESDDDSQEISVEDDDSDYSSDKDYKLNACKGTRKVGRRPAKRKANTGEVDLIDMLLDSISKEKTDFLCKEKAAYPASASVKDENAVMSQCKNTILPLKFRFEDDKESCLPVNTEWEVEIDSLFGDLEMALWESENGCTNSNMSDDEGTISRDINESRAARCGRGEHDDVVLDEQTGIVCNYCSAVLLEIKHVLPPFYVERHARKEDAAESHNSLMNKIQFEDSISSNLESTTRSKGTVLDLIPDHEKELYPHQLEGFEFLWRNIAGDIHINNLEKLPANGGRGCIISHAPGTGKTRLTIVFLQTFMKLYPNSRPVIIAPRGMLLTWEQEFKKWKVDLNFHNLNETKLSGVETSIATTLVDSRHHEKNNNKDYVRFVKLCSWMKGGSVLGIGYHLFEELAGDHKKKNRFNNNDKFKKILLELPGLLVLDEGHTPRNHQSLTWNALTKTTTRRRVILSGTPFQNNFTELYNTLCLVNPRFSQQIVTTSTNCGRKRRKGINAAREEWANLTNSISKNNTRGCDLDLGVKKLRSMIEPFVHIHRGDILQKTLPGMMDSMIVLKPTDLQTKLLQKIAHLAENNKFLEQSYLASLISVHPALVINKPEFSDYKRKLKPLESDPNAGIKTRFLVKLIELSIRLREKVLVFSEFIDPLLHIKKLIKRHFSWNEGREVMYMDGDLSIKQRQHLINSFNDKDSEVKVLLASQRACSEGINLVGASRVVLLDVAWNPSVERQAICRAYRIGQEKMVYVYHVVTLMELKKYARQAEKERISDLIFSHHQGGSKKLSSNEVNVVSEDKVLEAMVGNQSVGSMFERIVHQPKESDLVNTFGFVDLK